MNKTNLIFFLLLMSVTIHAQDSISLIPINYHDEFESIIKKRAASPDSWIFYSKNKKNAALIETYPPDKFKEEKARRKIIKLYDYSGNLLASSAPMDLYDWTVIPMGDDETILVVFPAGTARQADILVLKRKGVQFEMGDEIHEKTGNFSIDTDFRGEHFLIALSAEKGIRGNSELRLYNNKGNQMWSYIVSDTEIYSIMLTNHYLTFSTKNLDTKQCFVYALNLSGTEIFKKLMTSYVGNYQFECSPDTSNRYFGVCSGDGIHLFTPTQLTELQFIKTKTNQSFYSSFKIMDDQSIIAVSKDQIVIHSPNGSEKSLMHQLEGVPELVKIRPQIILEMWTPEGSRFYEIKQ